MRRTKFRSWNPVLKRMSYGAELKHIGFQWNYNTESWQVLNLVSGNEVAEDLMQYTGLKDIDDKEIYEGDIVGWFRPSDGCEVEFRNGAFGIESFGQWIVLGLNAQHFALVIGNKYQHPHLLPES